MLSTFVALVTVLAFQIHPTQAGWDLPASCPTNGHLSLPNGKRYVAPSDEQVDYATAQARCAAEGGTVALPLDTNEQAYLVFFKNCLNQNAQFWLGLSRPVGTWVDSQGSALGGFSAWAPGEPDERTKLCSRLVFGAQSNSERRNKWADAPCGESFRYICKTNGWLTGNTSWIVDASGNDATRALDGDAGSFWNPPGPPGISQDWYMVLDLGQPYNLTRLAVNSYGDTTHDVAAFKLQKAQVWIPYTWEDVATVRYVQGGTNQRQEFGGFQGTARYWKFTIMRTHSIYQPWFGELNLYGFSSADAVGVWPLNSQYGASDRTGNGNDGVARGTQLAPGPNGDPDGAFLFSGTANSYIDIPNNGKLDVQYSYTILAHIYPTGQAGPIFNYVGTNGQWAAHLWHLTPQHLYMRALGRDGHHPEGVGANVLQQHAWNYVGGTYDSSTGFAILWNNGQAVAQVQVGVPSVATQYPVRVAVRAGDSRYFAGRIACIQLYNYAMTQEQIEAAWETCFPRATPPPENFRITTITGTSVTAAWTPTSNLIAFGYRVWIREGDSADTLFTHYLPIIQTEVTFQNLIPATEYIISATTINMYVEGPDVIATVITATEPPSELDVEDRTIDTVAISWQPPKGVIVEYSISYTGNGRGTSVTSPGDTHTCVLTGLIPGTRYDIALVAVSRVGRSVAVTTSVLTETDPPSAVDISNLSSTWMVLEWTAPQARVVSYKITVSQKFSEETFSVDGSKTSYNVTDLLPETDYVIKMAAVGEHGRSVEVTCSKQTDKTTYSTSPAQTTAGTDEKLQHILQGMDQSQLESGKPEDILSVMNSINDVITAGAQSSMPSSVMEDISALVETLASASRGAQGASVTSMAAIADALTKTASAVIDMLPEQQPPIMTSSNILESELIDLGSADVSPKQQLKMLKDKQKENEDMERNMPPKDDSDYRLWMSAAGCSSWEETTEQWGLEQCDANLDIHNNVFHCQCRTVGSSIAVGTMTLPVPNSIDFINAFKNFSKVGENAVVFSIVVSEFILYVLLMVLLCVDFNRLRCKTPQDQRNTLPKVSLIPPDRMPAPHVYQLTVTTGSMFGAGTTSRVAFQLFGSEGTTPIKMLNPRGEALVRGSTLHFIMPVRESLGEVLLLHIWHDNSGEGDTASWFLENFLVRDIEKDVVSYFCCHDWLAEDKGDGEVQRVVHETPKEELSSFSNVFTEATSNLFYDQQLWTSVIATSPGSSFTQAQRLSCCFTLLNTMMLASAMWYQTDDTTDDTRVYNLGVARFTAEIVVLAAVLSAVCSLPFLARPPGIRKEDLKLNLWNSAAPKKIHPPTKPNCQAAKKKRELGKKSTKTFKELLLLVVFVVVLFYIAQTNNDQRIFYETGTLSTAVLREYDTIRTPDQFYTWAEEVLLPTLYPSAWYNGRKMKFLDRQFAQNTESFRVGPPRLNQDRRRPGDLGFESFVDLTTAEWWDACFTHSVGIVVFINTVALLRVVRFSQTIAKLLALPGIMKDELLSFLIVAAVAFMSFISAAYLIFGSHLKSYSDLYHTTFALFEMMLGRFFANDMLEANPLIGPIFFSAFMVCIFTLLMNFLMSIVCDAISADVAVDHDQDLADHMWSSVCAKFGLHSPPRLEEEPDELKMEKLQENLRIIREQLDESLDICESILPSRRRSNLDGPSLRANRTATHHVINTRCEVKIVIQHAEDD
ncbi:PREDICTED: uncharacterized protein LOC109468117 [Branchiostoma belcheri]|uniref:Uncharacterized protein LOC109468117 n=1 Tax=Branchiostoma belcheri TaxID=7741 RepID=A0A6P4YXD6_BRABE|nr:PREDICTED: uncharacterized protein LOC109468117 [Branchiostoma belcheri]